MQRVHFWLQHKYDQNINNLKFTNIKISITKLKQLVFNHSNKSFNSILNTPTKKFENTKKIAQITGIALLSLPAKSLIFSYGEETQVTAYDSIIDKNTLVLASVVDNSTFFSTDGFNHGFGYDLARLYAEDLGVNIKVKSYDTNAEALIAVNKGDADMALTTASKITTDDVGLTAVEVSCGSNQQIIENGLHPNINWAFRNQQDPLVLRAKNFLCNDEQIDITAKIANFYDQNVLKNDYSRLHFENALKHKLPTYKASFIQQASNYNHDWQLLVAMGYQESHLNANAISPTGVKGIMMLTNSTAEAMGVSDRVDPSQSISGGARYLDELKNRFKEVPEPDRLWFALASYNMGPNAIKKIQSKLEAQDKNPNSWPNVYAYMSEHASSNSRYVQCMQYVTHIRTYLETIKTQMA